MSCRYSILYTENDSVLEKHLFLYLVSEYLEGELLTEHLKHQLGRHLHPFQVLHLLHALAKGIEYIHSVDEYHGDLHTDNIIVQNVGLNYNPELINMFQWQDTKRANIKSDVMDLIRNFYDALGGQNNMRHTRLKSK